MRPVSSQRKRVPRVCKQCVRSPAHSLAHLSSHGKGCGCKTERRPLSELLMGKRVWATMVYSYWIIDVHERTGTFNQRLQSVALRIKKSAMGVEICVHSSARSPVRSSGLGQGCGCKTERKPLSGFTAHREESGGHHGSSCWMVI